MQDLPLREVRTSVMIRSVGELNVTSKLYRATYCKVDSPNSRTLFQHIRVNGVKSSRRRDRRHREIITNN